MSKSINDILSDEVMGRVVGRMRFGRPLTAKEFRAYAKVQAEMQREDEINEAISVLESTGYNVSEPTK